MENTPPAPPPEPPSISAVPVRKCKVEEFLNPQVIALLNAAPNNPSARVMVLASVKQMPAPELDTFEKIKDWIEYNFSQPVPSRSNPRRTNNIAFRIAVSDEYTEYGRATYTVNVRAEEDVEVSVGDIMESFEDNPDDLDALVDDVVDKFEDAIREHDFEHEYGDYEYDSEESTDTDNQDTTWSTDTLRRRVIEFLSRTLSDEQKDALGI